MKGSSCCELGWSSGRSPTGKATHAERWVGLVATYVVSWVGLEVGSSTGKETHAERWVGLVATHAVNWVGLVIKL